MRISFANNKSSAIKLNLRNSEIISGLVFQLLIIFSFASANFIIYGLTILFLFIYYIFPHGLNISRNVFILVFFYLVIVFLMVLVKAVEDPNLIFKSLFSIVGLLAASILVKDLKIHYFCSGFALIFFQFFVFCNILYYGFENFPAESPLEKVFDGKSGNGITSYIIILQIHFYVCHIIYHFRVDKMLNITIVSTLLISMSTYARGSLIAAFMLIFITFIVFRFSKKFILILCLLVFGLLISDFDSIVDLFNRYSKLSQGLEDYSRTEALKQYLNKIDIISFFIGADYRSTIIDNELSGNPHNSFIRAHHNYGILYIVFILFLFGLSVFIGKGIKKHILYGSLMLVLLFRIWTEPILFPTIFDFYFFSIVFLIFSYERTNIRL